MFNIKANIPDAVNMYDMSNLFDKRVKDDFIEKFGHTIENIKVISGQITQKEIDRALKVLKSYPVLTERDHCYPTVMIPGFKPCKDHYEFADEISVKLLSVAEKAFGEELIEDHPVMYMTHPTGSHIGPHTDILDITYETNDPERDAGPTQEEQLEIYENMWSGHLAILVYLNDDYVGGHLYFPEFDYYITPKPGDIVIFPGSLYYVHGVSEITSGVRYTLSKWARFKFYNQKY
jgi:hypothetical protein